MHILKQLNSKHKRSYKILHFYLKIRIFEYSPLHLLLKLKILFQKSTKGLSLTSKGSFHAVG